MYRIHRDESNYSAKKLLAWHWVLPHMHLPITESDTHNARKFEVFIDGILTDDEAGIIVKRIGLRGQ